ncbi:hypothetical protein K402DRAFT_395635 [Aulographum hederae CBS 113979]|uniref:Uncharacterized protein n=1 Tax=Aulographum hederae CBS 113979 TaxID=1176131 RepID=A0A6G1GUY8_9PEZI|nr:hypothetical protein K402DRAFT_395635 [Aulographum hederae CBS 113979]
MRTPVSSPTNNPRYPKIPVPHVTLSYLEYRSPKSQPHIPPHRITSHPPPLSTNPPHKTAAAPPPKPPKQPPSPRPQKPLQARLRLREILYRSEKSSGLISRLSL